MRGAPGPVHAARGLRGIIPAYAGSTTPTNGYPRSTRDHPRVCGEHSKRGFLKSQRKGSSPRMRGAQDGTERGGDIVGIIPAYAGSTGVLNDQHTCNWDHPRVCGEHSGLMDHSTRVLGSSPRMRGALKCSGFIRVISGIIPAYAGSTPAAPTTSARGWDHPRVCGEHRRNVRNGLCD